MLPSPNLSISTAPTQVFAACSVLVMAIFPSSFSMTIRPPTFICITAPNSRKLYYLRRPSVTTIAICFGASPFTVPISTTPTFVFIATSPARATLMHLLHAATIFTSISHNYFLPPMDNAFAPPRIVSQLFSRPNFGINVLVIRACINFAISNSVPQAFLLASIALFIRFTSARRAKTRALVVHPWDRPQPPPT